MSLPNALTYLLIIYLHDSSTEITYLPIIYLCASGRESELTSETDNFWCTKLSAAFYQHMGWMAKPGEPNGKQSYEYFPGAAGLYWALLSDY